MILFIKTNRAKSEFRFQIPQVENKLTCICLHEFFMEDMDLSSAVSEHGYRALESVPFCSVIFSSKNL